MLLYYYGIRHIVCWMAKNILKHYSMIAHEDGLEVWNTQRCVSENFEAKVRDAIATVRAR